MCVVVMAGQKTCAQTGRGDGRLTIKTGHGLHLNMEGHFVLHFDYLRECHESIDELLSQHLFDDVLVVIVSEGATQFVVVHVVLILSEAPESGHLFGVDQLELAICVCPRNYVFVLQSTICMSGDDLTGQQVSLPDYSTIAPTRTAITLCWSPFLLDNNNSQLVGLSWSHRS